MQKRVAVKKQQNSSLEAREFLTNLPQDPPVHPLVQVYTVPEDDCRVALRGSLGCRVSEGEGESMLQAVALLSLEARVIATITKRLNMS